MVSNSEGCWGGVTVVVCIGDGCGETSFCVWMDLICEDCGVDGMSVVFEFVSQFFRFVWWFRVIRNLGLLGLEAVMV